MAPIENRTTSERRPRRAAVVALAVLALTFFAFPAAVVEWVGEHCQSGPVCEGLVAAATAVEDLSRAFGIADVMDDARSRLRHDLAIDQY